MRAALLATLLSAVPSAFAWQITLYRNNDCNAADYYTFEGSEKMDYCWGIKEGTFPNGAKCQYFKDGGRDGPHKCDGQIDNVTSFKVVRGKVAFWQDFDSHPSQPTDRRCSARLDDNGWKDVDREESGVIFRAEDYRCRNAYFTGIYDRINWRDIRGFRAWD